MAKIRARDPEWEQLALRGLKWQKLHWKVMLVPGAVITITNALTVKSSTAMEIGGNDYPLAKRLIQEKRKHKLHKVKNPYETWEILKEKYS